MGNFIILETDIDQGKERNQAKISLKNEKLSFFKNIYGRRDMEAIRPGNKRSKEYGCNT